MSVNHALCLAAILAASGSVHAQSCALGPQGGMDANGDECSATVGTAYDVDPAVWAHISARMQKPALAGPQPAATVMPTMSGGSAAKPIAVVVAPLPSGSGASR